MSFVRLFAAALVALSMAACAGTPETGQGPKENTGTLVGAVAGGLIGSQFGGGTGERIAAGLAGKNPDSGRYGSVVPGPAYQSNGLQCRPYTHTIYIDGRPEVARGNACRNPDGTWTAVG